MRMRRNLESWVGVLEGVDEGEDSTHLVLPVDLEMFSYSDGLFDEMVQVFWDGWGEAWMPKY